MKRCNGSRMPLQKKKRKGAGRGGGGGEGSGATAFRQRSRILPTLSAAQRNCGTKANGCNQTAATKLCSNARGTRKLDLQHGNPRKKKTPKVDRSLAFQAVRCNRRIDVPALLPEEPDLGLQRRDLLRLQRQQLLHSLFLDVL